VLPRDRELFSLY